MTLYLDKEHGVNPSLDQCFYCLGDKGVVLFGKLKQQTKEALGAHDGRAPHKICLDREPCDECKEHMAQGVVLISVDEARSTDMKNPYRTGGWCVVTDDMIERLIEPAELREAILRQRVAFLPDEAWEMLGLPELPKTG